jgi:hypothetical protein
LASSATPLPWIDRVWRVLHELQSPHRLSPLRRIRDLVAWNDQPGRTQSDVITAVHAADSLNLTAQETR